jgi:hypothetical protein
VKELLRTCGSVVWFIVQAFFVLVVLGWAFYAWVWPVLKFLVILIVLLLSPIWVPIALILPYALGAAAFLAVVLIVIPTDKKS